MPLPTDDKLIALSQDLLQQFDTIFGLHPGSTSPCQGHDADGYIHTFA
jgi:hypothetical protein